MPEIPTDATVQKIRSLCHELAARHGLDEPTRDELCGHLEDKLIGYLSGSVRISEDDALELVRAHFGNADRIARGLRRERSVRFFSWSVEHNRLYTLILIILGLSTTLSTPLGIVLWNQRSPSARGFPNWALPVDVGICGFYVVVIAITVLLRRLRPVVGQRLTRILNYLLLLAPPFGTALGIYGLVAVDKKPQLAN
jgi:hypothetical protein